MSLETDLLLDRRRIQRRLNFWRLLAVAAVVAAAIIVIRPGRSSLGPHIARVVVHGVISEDRRLIDAVLALAKDRSVPAVILDIDSPGGTVAGGESLRAALLRVAAAKPVVAVMGGTAASAGYMIAMPAARIFAREATLTGSIGVILETGEVSGLLGKLGVSATAITSGPLKDQPSFTRPLTQPGREYLQGLVTDMFDQFVEMVALGRHMDVARVRELADGRAYTGRQALKLGLVDQIGGETEARAWLAQTHHIADSTPVREVRLGSAYARAFRSAMGLLSGTVADALGRPMSPGAWSVWQAGAPD